MRALKGQTQNLWRALETKNERATRELLKDVRLGKTLLSEVLSFAAATGNQRILFEGAAVWQTHLGGDAIEEGEVTIDFGSAYSAGYRQLLVKAITCGLRPSDWRGIVAKVIENDDFDFLILLETIYEQASGLSFYADPNFYQECLATAKAFDASDATDHLLALQDKLAS